MKIHGMIAAELKRLTSSRMAVLTLAALLVIPILYGGLYLWANQNPYDMLDKVPVAIVLEDDGTTVNGTKIDHGRDVVEQLIDQGNFAYSEVDAAEATAGLETERFNFSITFPPDFSEALESAATDQPRQAEVILTTNDANSYLGTTIAQQASQEIRTAIVKQVNSQAAMQFLLGLATIRGDLVTAAGGVEQLLSGSNQAHGAADALTSGAQQLAAGAQRLADGNTQLADKADQVGSVLNELTGLVPQVGADIRADLTTLGVDPAEIDRIMARLDTVGERVEAGNSRAQDIIGQVDELADGSRQVASGLGTAASGAAELTQGLETLTGGISELGDGLSTGLAQIPDTTTDMRDHEAALISDPVTINTSALTHASNYGAGLAPFFGSIAAWIGAYALFLVINPASRRAMTALHSPVRIAIAGWLVPTILGAVQMSALFVVLRWVLGFEMAHPWGVYGLLLIMSAAFSAIVLALNVWWGDVGQFIGLVIMVLQLATAGGTFPWQTLPEPLQVLHHILPMSYSVDALRQLMYGGNLTTALSDVLVLIGWALVGVLLTVIRVTRRTRFQTLHDLEPPLIQ